MSRRMIDEAALNNTLEVALDTKQDKLTAGDGVTIENNVISAAGGGFKYKIENIQSTIYGVSGEHTYTVGEQLGYIDATLTPPDDFHDGIVVLLGTSCDSSSTAQLSVGTLRETTGDIIHYIVNARISYISSRNVYTIFARVQAINGGTATKGSSTNSYASVRYAWIYN